MNIQELQILVSYKLPLKVFVLENEGYLAIKTTQKAFFGGKFTGSNPTSGVSSRISKYLLEPMEFLTSHAMRMGSLLWTQLQKFLQAMDQ